MLGTLAGVGLALAACLGGRRVLLGRLSVGGRQTRRAVRLLGSRKALQVVVAKDVAVAKAGRARVGIVEVLLLLLSREVSKQSEGHNK